MGWKGTLKAIEAAERRQQRDAQKRLRELERQSREQAKLSAIELARFEVETYEGGLEVLLSVHKEQGGKPSDASVPFDFDVHAMIPCEDAPALEHLLHTEFDDLRINKVNFQKEFFRVPLERLRSLIIANGIQASFTMVAEAHEYRETQVLNKMTPGEREKYHLRRQEGSGSMVG